MLAQAKYLLFDDANKEFKVESALPANYSRKDVHGNPSLGNIFLVRNVISKENLKLAFRIMPWVTTAGRQKLHSIQLAADAINKQFSHPQIVFIALGQSPKPIKWILEYTHLRRVMTINVSNIQKNDVPSKQFLEYITKKLSVYCNYDPPLTFMLIDFADKGESLINMRSILKAQILRVCRNCKHEIDAAGWVLEKTTQQKLLDNKVKIIDTKNGSAFESYLHFQKGKEVFSRSTNKNPLSTWSLALNLEKNPDYILAKNAFLLALNRPKTISEKDLESCTRTLEAELDNLNASDSDDGIDYALDDIDYL